MNNKKGYFMEPQNFSVNDGNGIRTIIFFAGCDLRCKWCSNPESWTNINKVAYYKKTCTNCERCKKFCPKDVEVNLNFSKERKKCISCGICSEICLTSSRKSLIYQYTSSDIIKFIDKQKIFYRYSGGGVTFSGGEATKQADILRELTYNLYDQALNLALETSGYFDFDEIKDILEKLDLIFVDIKHMDNSLHKYYTGLGNELILNNISRLKEINVPVVVRIPLIAGVNSDLNNIRLTSRFLKNNLPNAKLELLPYHSFGDEKYDALGLELPPKEFKAPEPENIRMLINTIHDEGIETISYR